MIYGNIDGLKKSILEQLEDLRGYRMEDGVYLDEDTATYLMKMSLDINREVIIVTDKRNEILEVGVGDFRSASFPEVDYDKISGVKSFHTHPNGNPQLSEQDLSAMENLGFDLLGAIAETERGLRIGVGVLDVDDEQLLVKQLGALSLKQLNNLSIEDYVRRTGHYKRYALSQVADEQEKAILVGVHVKSRKDHLDMDSSMAELAELAKTAGVLPVEAITQNKDRVDSAFYIGKGKLLEIRELIQILGANIILCNDELSAVQLRNMEKVLGVKIIDRTALILDIFAKHARSGEGKLQVELAQLKYRLPRLMGMGKVLSRTGAGIGTRGPGEKKLETDRRAIYRQVTLLEKRLLDMESTRKTQKSRRVKNEIPVISLVGYTNAGKSTLFNRISDSSVLAQDMLFATLDSTTRKIVVDDKEFLLSDTVGFIEKLPHDLVESFKSTLEEVKDADLVLHIIDSANPNYQQQMAIVEDVLTSIGCGGKEMFLVFNKVDLLEDGIIPDYEMIRGDKIMVSAKNGQNVDALMDMILGKIFGDMIETTLKVPYTDTKYSSYLHSLGVVTAESFEEDGVLLTIRISEKNRYLLERGKTDG
jgi:GTP-binding protein HflX